MAADMGLDATGVDVAGGHTSQAAAVFENGEVDHRRGRDPRSRGGVGIVGSTMGR
jgi:hypothetical protein